MDATLEKTCDSFLNGTAMPAIQTAQAAFLAKRGRYWQGALTPTNLPTKTVKRAPDLSLSLGPDEGSWADLGISLSATIPCALEVHTYDGPDGKGWVLIGSVLESGVLWRRAVNAEGPEKHRTMATWQRVLPATTAV